MSTVSMTEREVLLIKKRLRYLKKIKEEAGVEELLLYGKLSDIRRRQDAVVQTEDPVLELFGDSDSDKQSYVDDEAHEVKEIASMVSAKIDEPSKENKSDLMSSEKLSDEDGGTADVDAIVEEVTVIGTKTIDEKKTEKTPKTQTKKTGNRNALMLQTLCDMSAGGEQFGIKNKHGDGTEFTHVGDFAITTKGMLMCDHGTSSMCKKTREVKNLQTADWSTHLWWKNRQTGEWVFFKEWYNTSHEKIW